jgi:hypothetical protein
LVPILLGPGSIDVFANNADADDAAAGDGDGDTVMMRSPPDVRGQPS